MFNSYSRKFTSIKPVFKLPTFTGSYCKAVGVGRHIIVILGIFVNNETEIYVYDVDKQTWSHVDCENCKNLYGSNCVKYYKQ